MAVPALLCAVLSGLNLGAAAASTARLYQWHDPSTGTLQLAGRAPPWYRDSKQGPRVRVYQAGRLLDDTARAVPPDDRAALRAAAFGLAAPGRAILPGPDATPSAPTIPPSPAVQRPATAAKIEEFKALLEAWDREQTAAAVKPIEPVPASPPNSPPPL